MEIGNFIKGLRDTISENKDLAEELRKYIIHTDEILTLSSVKYNEFIEGILMKDITSSEQLELGITVLHVISNNETDFSLHMHENQSQTVSVIKGKILDLENNMMFHQGESFFVTKNHEHRLRYCNDTELLIVYMPALIQVKK